MKIFLCGFMGAGKTHLLKSLEKRSRQSGKHWEFLDLDDLLFEKLKSPADKHLGQTIERLGWDKFRALEKSTILEILTWKMNVCVGLGGGGLNPEVLEAIKMQMETLLIWLDTPLPICLERIQSDPVRPLAQKSELELLKLFMERLPLYKAAHICASDLDQEMLEQNCIDLEQLVRKHVGSA